MRAMSRRKSIAKAKGGQKKLMTVSAHFRQSLDLLMERVFSASPHFVRCIKPNHEKRPLICSDEFILKQLCYTGMLEAVRVRREGYAYRPYFSDFFNSYRGVAFHYTDPVSTWLVACRKINFRYFTCALPLLKLYLLKRACLCICVYETQALNICSITVYMLRCIQCMCAYYVCTSVQCQSGPSPHVQWGVTTLVV